MNNTEVSMHTLDLFISKRLCMFTTLDDCVLGSLPAFANHRGMCRSRENFASPGFEPATFGSVVLHSPNATVS